MNTDKYLKFAIFFSVTGLILGAIGAHASENTLTTKQIISFKTAIRYQMFHAISILTLVLNHKKFNSKLKRSLNLMIIGVFCFSFSIYLLNLQEVLRFWLTLLKIITPIGGLLLIIAWCNLFFALKKNN